MPAPAVTRRASAALMASAACLIFLSVFVATSQPFPQHFLYFFPLPHGQGSLRPIFGSRMSGLAGTYSAVTGGDGGDTGA
jgi:hypothetical protein